MKENPIVWFEIYVADMPRARAFYEAVLGQTLVPLGPPDDTDLEMWSFAGDPHRPGAGGALVRSADAAPAGGKMGDTLVYFRCDDCAAEAARVEGAGGKLTRAKMPIGPYGFIALAVDTEGNPFGLHSMS